MKKILFLFVLLAGVSAYSQTGYTTINARYNWLAGIFKALGLPAGDSAQFTAGQSQRQGSVYMDTVNTPDSPNGYYIYEDPTGGNSPFWNLQRNDQICQNRLTSEWNVSWQGVGFNYSVHGGLTDGQGSYQIGCSFYTADSTTVTFNPADPDEDRIDIIYLDATGVHVREGDLAAPGTAVRPTVDADEILLTEVLVAAGATAPTLTQLIVYDENTESVVTNTGTTTNGANNTFVFNGSLNTNVTNITHNDQVFFTKAPPASTWGVLGFDGISLTIRLKATMPTNANLGIALQVGSTTSGVEVIIPLVKTNSSSTQQISIPISAFGNMANTNITRVRFRYIRPASGANYTGFYLDYIYFVDGFSTGPSPTATFTFNPPVGFSVTPSNTQQSPGTWTMGYAAGTQPGQYYTREGFVTLPEFVDEVGAFEGRAPTADGAVVDGDEIFFWPANATEPGMMTPAMFLKLDSNYYIANAGDGDTLAFPDPIEANITRIKSVKGIGGIVITTTDTTVIWDGSGVGGSGGRFGVSGEDDAAGESRIFDAGGENFSIVGDGSAEIEYGTNDEGDNVQYLEFTDAQNMRVGGTYLLGSAQTRYNSSGAIIQDSDLGLYEFTNLADDGTATKVVVYNTTSDQIGTVDLAGLGGGSGATTALDNLASVAINTSLISDADNTDDLGSSSNAWKDIYARRLLLDGATSGTAEIIADALSNVISGTVLSGTGTIPVEYDIYVRADETLANTTSDQPLFTNAAHDVITILANTTYDFEAYFDLTHSAVSHDLQFGMIPTTATITNIAYYSILNSVAVGTPNTSQYSTSVKVTNTNPINLAAANAVESVIIRGWFTVGNTGGTIQPTIQFSADPTGTILLKAGARFKVIPRGNDTFTEKGPIN